MDSEQALRNVTMQILRMEMDAKATDLQLKQGMSALAEPLLQRIFVQNEPEGSIKMMHPIRLNV